MYLKKLPPTKVQNLQRYIYTYNKKQILDF